MSKEEVIIRGKRRQEDKNMWNIKTARLITFLLLGISSWLIFFCLFGIQYTGPKSPIFKLIVLFVCAKSLGVVCKIIYLPPMIGMLGVGVLLRNVEYVNLENSDYMKINSALRQLALINILLVAGLGLDAKALKRMSGLVIGLAILAPLVEILSATVFAFGLLQFPWLWCLLFGLLLGAVSPALVIPCLLKLQSKGYGIDKGIHTLVIASSAIDDIACIAGFGVFVGIIFGKQSLTSQILEGPISIIIGGVYGLFFGILARFLPYYNDKFVTTLRTLFIGCFSLLAIFGSQAIGYEGAGSLACIIAAFVASIGWKNSGWTEEHPVKINYSILWEIFEPISFSLIGLEVNFKILKGGVVLYSVLAILLALIMRILISYLIMKFSNLNFKEKVFVCICNIPKATVQAALGPLALDYARNLNDEIVYEYANALLITAVVSIIITAPIGALLIVYTGPRLLNRTNVNVNSLE